ncbi:MAG: hypothetical protein ACP5KS_06135, partial [Candidatus Hydrogenedens sp.]
MYYLFTFIFIVHVIFDYANEIGSQELQWLNSDSLTKKKIITTLGKEKILELEVTENNEENKWHHISSDFPVDGERFVYATARMRLV